MDRDAEELAEVEAKLVGLSLLFDFLLYVIFFFFLVDSTLVLLLG